MLSLKTLRPHLLYRLLKHPKPSLFTQPPPHILSHPHEPIKWIPPLSQRTFFSTEIQLVSDPDNNGSIEMARGVKSKKPNKALDVQEAVRLSEKVEGESESKKQKKPLDVLFKEAVGLSEKAEGESETEEVEEEEEGLSKKLEETNELKKKLEKIEREVISMKGEFKDRKAKKKTMKKIESVSVEGSKQVSLYSLFASNPKKSESDLRQTEKSVVSEEKQEFKPMEELSPDTILLVKHLHEKGYLKGANFLRSHMLDLKCFSTLYSRSYLRCAAERFVYDHREKAMCLSEIDLKRLALFGCPSVDKKAVFAAKRLRSYFNIQEDIVCRPCKLNSSCKFKNHTVGRKAYDFYIADVMKILTLYALEMVPPQLIIPDEVKDAVSRLLKQVVKLGNTLDSDSRT